MRCEGLVDGAARRMSGAGRVTPGSWSIFYHLDFQPGFYLFNFFFLVSSPVLGVHESTVWKQRGNLVGELIRKTQRQLQFSKLELTK